MAKTLEDIAQILTRRGAPVTGSGVADLIMAFAHEPAVLRAIITYTRVLSADLSSDENTRSAFFARTGRRRRP